MRVVHYPALMLLACFVLYSSSSEACRHVLPGSLSKSNEANFSYFDHVDLIEVVGINSVQFESEAEKVANDYARLRVIKSYKGDLPEEFFVLRTSSAACGQDFHKGDKFLAFFDARLTAGKVASDRELPVIHTSLVDFTTSRLIPVSDLPAADRIIESAKQR